jgi:hypothetical protein
MLRKRLVGDMERVSPPSSQMSALPSVGTVLHLISVVCLAIIAYAGLSITRQLASIGPKVLEVSEFVKAHEQQLESAADLVDSVEYARANLQLIGGSIPALAGTILKQPWGDAAESITRFLKGLSTTVRKPYPSSGVERVLDDVAKYSSLVASISVKMMELRTDNGTKPVTAATTSLFTTSATGAEQLKTSEASNDEDGGLALGFLNAITSLVKSQLQPQEWTQMADSCVSLVNQLDKMDWLGYYYCGSGYSQGCSWDMNHDFHGTVLPEIKEVCQAVGSLSVSPPGVTPGECNIAFDGICGNALRAGGDQCIDCVHANVDKFQRLGCSMDEGREFCQVVQYRCLNSQCVPDNTGGIDLPTCQAICA